ncbi:MAG: hypothetical protein JRE43_00150 [Deltaproteobacteria bacterium]|jgi:hypothetical protein|nr:hypothetical protein [Deltaproteobacteria bacterium]
MWLDVYRDRYVYEGTGLRDEGAVERARDEFLATNPGAKGDWRTNEEAFNALIAEHMGRWGYAWSDEFWTIITPLLELMKRVGSEEGFRLAVILFPVDYQVKSELLVNQPQQNFARIMTELGIPHLDLLPLLRNQYQRDGVNLFYDHCHYRPEGNEFLARPVADFLLREVISR